MSVKKGDSISKNHFVLLTGSSTIEATYLVRRLMKKYITRKEEDLYMVFIDLEIAYDKVPR